jgi:hypothetical protein
MRYQFNFHRRIGITPSFGITFTNYGIGGVLMLRLWWSALTLAFDIPKRYRKVEDEETRFYRKLKEAFDRRYP